MTYPTPYAAFAKRSSVNFSQKVSQSTLGNTKTNFASPVPPSANQCKSEPRMPTDLTRISFWLAPATGTDSLWIRKSPVLCNRSVFIFFKLYDLYIKWFKSGNTFYYFTADQFWQCLVELYLYFDIFIVQNEEIICLSICSNC